jgi:hypothetical protein
VTASADMGALSVRGADRARRCGSEGSSWCIGNL